MYLGNGHVASHARQRPLCHGTVVMSSGRFPFGQRTNGSRVARTESLVKARWTMSFIWLCCECRPALFRQASPWWPSARTSASQTHRCGWTSAAPSQSPAAIRTPICCPCSLRTDWSGLHEASHRIFRRLKRADALYEIRLFEQLVQNWFATKIIPGFLTIGEPSNMTDVRSFSGSDIPRVANIALDCFVRLTIK